MEKTAQTQKEEKITLEKYAKEVHELRRAQRLFFRTRKPEYLQQSKEAEAKVDKKTADIMNPQPSLF